MASAKSIELKIGLPAIELDNDSLRLKVLPSLGAKIYECFWKEKNRNILWQKLEQGFYGWKKDTQSETGFLLQWPLQQRPYLWMWLVYGGWRGHYHIEPSTSYPNTLTSAVASKTHRNLAVGETFSIELNATGYARPETHMDALKRVERERK